MVDIRNFLEHEEEYYKPARVDNFCNNPYIEYESNGDRNKTPSAEKYLNKIRLYLSEYLEWSQKKFIHEKFYCR